MEGRAFMRSARQPRGRPRRRPESAYQFLIALSNTNPLVWRRIEVPDDYSFWDLHVAIQDAMGWSDSHLHEFTIAHPTRSRIERLGIPDEDEFSDQPCTPGWKVPVSRICWATCPHFSTSTTLEITGVMS